MMYEGNRTTSGNLQLILSLKEFRYEPPPDEIRAVIIASWRRGGSATTIYRMAHHKIGEPVNSLMTPNTLG